MLKKPQSFKSKGVMTLDKLAGMMANGFSNLEEKLGGRIDKVEERLTDVEDRLSQKISGLENRIDYLAEGKASREEVKTINIRLTRVEKKFATK
ncbi:hypothetical protein EPO17_03215 [Patescibacteria group bacterium]|nr:MAG: hypothetical protein EPO17_03215 [Patescibacteria group bacterium]